MHFDSINAFDKEFKKLFKKYKSLDSDLKRFKKLLQKNINLFITQSTNHHAIIYTNTNRDFFVLKSRLQCRYLKSGALRVIYFYLRQKEKIIFIEIYFKGDKPTEDTQRWQNEARKLNYYS